MAVTNRGSILISTANDIGSSLVDVIGGEGYTPNEWAKEVNLCGIAAADIPTALANIEESTPSGTDRGSISLDTANAVGAVLNKKFNTARGFKPSEWASAISKLTELEVKTASGSVASFDDGADDVPLKSCTCEIVPQQDLHGYANPWAPGCGSNLLDPSKVVASSGAYNLNISYSNNTIRIYGTSSNTGSSVYFNILTYADFSLSGNNYVVQAFNGRGTGTFKSIYGFRTSSEKTVAVGFDFSQSAEIDYTFEISVSPTSQSAYSPYSNICPIEGTTEIEVTHTDGQNPPIESETKTAALGRTVLGGSHDFISGVLSENLITKNAREYSWGTINQGGDLYFTTVDATLKAAGSSSILKCNYFATVNGQYLPGTPVNNTMYHAYARYYNINIYCPNIATTIEEWNTFIQNNDVIFTIPLSEANVYDLEGQEISSYLGDNNIFSDVQGGTTTVEYRADIDLAAT